MQRKTARKLALIQWACFQNEVAEMRGSTLFTGVNGTGKSTILDAMSYLLTANTQFNLAAKDRDRTVRGYVRGDTKSNGKDQFLRTGEVVSYIAMEFSSETEDETFVIGVCIESPNPSDKCNPYWFILKDTALSDVVMAEEKDHKLYVFPRKQLRVKGKLLKMQDFLSRDKAKPQIVRALGMRCDAETYRSKLVKMMAFNPENNIDQFIQNCVLEAGNVNSLKELRAQKERFEEFRGIYENLKISRDKLDVVEKKTQEYENRYRQFLNRTLMLKYQDLLFSKNEKEEIERRSKKLAFDLAATEEASKEAAEKQREVREHYDNIRSQEGFQDIRKSLDAIDAELRTLKAQMEKSKSEIENLKNLRKTISELKEQLQEDWTADSEAEMVYDALGETSYTAEETQEKIRTLSERLTACVNQYLDESSRLRIKQQGQKEQLSELVKCLDALGKRRLPFPHGAEEMRKTLHQELSRLHGNVRVRFFAELVQEVSDPGWRKAIETFLGRKRFYLIVDDAYVVDALRIINEKKLHATNLVLTDRIPSTEITKGSAAEALTIPNAAARRYANYLLNGIILCDTVEELHEHPKGGLMRDGMLAKSYAASMMDMGKTRMFLGSDAVELQTKAYQKEKDALEQEMQSDEKRLALIRLRQESIQKADIRVKDYRFLAPFRLQADEKEYQETEKQRENIASDPGFLQILEEVNRIQKQLDNLTEQGNQLNEKKGHLKKALEDEEEHKKRNAGEILVRENQYQEFLMEHPDLEREMKADYEKMRQRSEEILVIKRNTVERLRTECDRAKEEMENAQLDYLRAAGMNLEKRGVSFIPFFHEERNSIANVRIEEAANKLESCAREMESSFMTDFVAEMNESIINAKKEVDAINEELRRLPFGSDTYSFMMDDREDRSEFFRICRKLNDFGSVNMLQSMNGADEELAHDIKSFMDKILAEQDESEFTDYRKYFKYDMRIRTKRGGNEVESDLSKKQGSASNGEKQTPYFIILAASLMQCYPRNTECARLAFIDEAFAALSRERIEQMVGYLEDNHFQVMYAAPPEKIASIGAAIDNTISLASSGRYTKMIEGSTVPQNG
ncbi:MAG: AAA family ATPase [Lachnospiraceae bacterium]|nr:AAA family ATPase [Lachnospiraceae bacterium]